MHRSHSTLAVLGLALLLALGLSLPATAEAAKEAVVETATSQPTPVQDPAFQLFAEKAQAAPGSDCDPEAVDLASLFGETDTTEMLTGCSCSVNSDCDDNCLDGGTCLNGICACHFGSCDPGGTGPGPGPGPGPGCGGPSCSRFSDCYAFCGGNTGGTCLSGCCLC